jgi:signal transduction histidine kinase
LNKVFDDAVNNLDDVNTGLIKHDRLPVINGVYSQFVIVFQNLLSNALKFNKKKPVIHVGYKKDGYKHVLSFSDNGIGIKSTDVERIFDGFNRLNPAGDYAGSGLGLIIVKRIIARHNGKVWAKSRLGKGSTFFISLPV